MYQNLKRRVYHLLDADNNKTIWDKIVKGTIIALIVINTVAIILETVNELYTTYKTFFIDLEKVTVIFFTIEYILRVWSCTNNDKYTHPIWGRLRYMFTADALIDVVAILPFYLHMVHDDFIFLRVLRLFRFLRFLKMGRYLHASRVMGRVIASKKEELVISLIAILFLIIVASTVMYYVEHDAQPQEFSSIPETMWWSVATLTTLGYGDIYPITPLGKTLTSLISVLGIGMFALPAGIIASGFSEDFRNRHKTKKVCPHCGEEIV